MTIWSENALQGGPQNRKLLQADSLHSLPHSETTLAKHLQDAGYLTALLVLLRLVSINRDVQRNTDGQQNDGSREVKED